MQPTKPEDSPLVQLPNCYVAAPFGAPTRFEQEANTCRAEYVGEIMRDRGFRPVVVHTAILAGAFGDDNDPAARARGLAATVEIMRDVLARGGVLVVLLRDDCTMSAGVLAEVTEARRVVPDLQILAMTTHGWRTLRADMTYAAEMRSGWENAEWNLTP